MTRLDTGAALLAAILAQPDEDTARLVYADYLDEQGESDRAEFVRVQCRIATLQRGCRCGACAKLRGGGQHHNGPCAVDRERDELPDGRSRPALLRHRERELLAAHEDEWLGEPFDRITPVGVGGRRAIAPTWSRGFVSEVRCPLAVLFGGPCGRCQRDGYVYDEATDHPATCPVCRGTGSVPGCAAEVWASQPVTEVRVTDAVIHPSGGNDTYYVGGLGRFPREYWSRLEGLPTRGAALTALSRAAVLLGRQRAGLTAPATDRRCETCGHWSEDTRARNGAAGISCPHCDGSGFVPTSG